MNKEKIDYEKMLLFLKSAPANIFFKDTECRYRFLTEVCDHVHGEGIGNSVIGKTDLEIHEDTHSGQMYYKDDLKILKTGQGSHFVSAYKTATGMRYYDIKKNPVFCNGEIIGIMGIIDDVTQQKEMEKKLEELSFKDLLTGLHNRNYYEKHGKDYFKREYFPVSIILGDCNYMKVINDQLGHEYGDVLLKRVAASIRDVIPENYIPIRLGGDEFLIICPNTSSSMSEEIIGQLNERLKVKSDDILKLDVSWGHSTAEDDTMSMEDVVRKADQAMYHKKFEFRRNRKNK